LLKADLVIFNFSIYWFSMPVIMKGWIDRVLVSGVCYGGKRFYDQGGLAGKKSMLASPSAVDPIAAHLVGMVTGKRSFDQITDLLARCGEHVDIVALSIAEHLPWDAQALKNALE
jgi:putative NADPH-quinone reductase